MLAIHVCCADCMLNALQNLKDNKLVEDGEKIYLIYYNPNIHPRAEYLERLKAIKEVIDGLDYKKDLKLVIPDYKPMDFIKAVTEGRGEDKNKCISCWKLRLLHLFMLAKENKVDRVATTLLTSHYQNADDINDIATNYSKEFSIEFVPINSESNCKHHGFYKQNYCGCCFSLTEKMLSKLKETTD